MIPQPLHPAVVHFPIVLVVILPLVAIVALWAIHRGAAARAAWWPVVAVSAVLVGASWVAVQTGKWEEDTVERVAADSAIEEHEESAELFLPLTVAGLLLVSTGLLADRPGRIGRHVAIAAALGLVIAGYRVGHTGGALVYEHGAATAYTNPRPGASAATYDDDHEDRERDRR